MHLPRTTTRVIVAAVALAGCSAEFSIGGSSPADAAEALIESELAAQAGVELTAACESPDDPGVGTEFSCTGETPDGRVVDFTVLIDSDDHISVDSVNAILADQLALLERGAVDALNTEYDLALEPSAVDCGDELVVLDESNVVDCALTEPDTGDVYDTTLTITDLDAGLFDIEVAEAPRS